jgi:hypothetical protein
MRSPPVASLGTPVPRPERPDLILTEFPVNVASTGAQPLELARDVLDLDELTLELQVLNLTGGTPDITVEVQTGMQIESTTGWVTVGSFTRFSAAPAAEVRVFTGLLRFVRWNVSTLAGTSGTFFLSGVGRRWSRRP